MTTIKSRTVLIAVSEYGEFSALLPLAGDLEERLNLHPVFVFAPGYGLVQEHGRLVAIKGWSWAQLASKYKSYRTLLDERSENGYIPTVLTNEQEDKSRSSEHNILTLTGIARAVGLLTLRLVSGSSRLLVRIAKLQAKPASSGNARSELSMQLRDASLIFKRTRPSLIVSGQDYPLSVTSFLSKVGESHGIKTAIVPFSMPPTTKEIIESFAYHGYNQVSGIERFLSMRTIPHWLNESRGRVYSRVSPAAAIASDSLGLTPPVPWLPNSGRGIVCVPSLWAKKYYEKAGIPSTQLRLTGAAWSDKLHRSAQTRAFRRAQLVSNVDSYAPKRRRQSDEPSKLLIISWPPNQYPRKSYGCTTYEDLCNQFITASQELQRSDLARIVVSLHPTLTDENLLKSLRRAKLFVLRSGLLDYIDCADVFVSTVSSTNFWALQCGIPTINFDGYLYGYTEFEEAGAITVITPQEFHAISARLLRDESFYAGVQNKIFNSSSLFFETGGRNLDRIMDELIKLMPSPC